MNFTKDWTLFLDRDGVINKRLPGDYVKTLAEFEFLPRAIEAIALFTRCFGRIVVVTNQQGIGKGLMTVQDLAAIHDHMLTEINKGGGHIDHVFFCPNLASEKPTCRKPKVGMGLEAKKMFPNIDFNRSLIIGDSLSDMEFGENLGMKCAYIGKSDVYEAFDSLIHVAERITSK